MSRFLGRAATAAACIAIVLLVVLLVILWTGVRTGTIVSGLVKEHDVNNDTVLSQSQGFHNEPSPQNQSPEMEKGPSSSSSISLERIPHRFEIFKVKTSWDEPENSTNEVRWQSTKANENFAGISKNLDEEVSTVENVIPLKIDRNIYEDPADDLTVTRHDTGHYRHPTSEIWDPHPQYKFKAFGKDFHLLLSHDISFVSPEIKVTHIGKNSTRREHPGHQLGCFYSGTVQGDPKSVVSVSLCHGMSGHIRTSTGNYFIEPADRQSFGKGSPADKPVLHLMYLASATRSNSNSVNLPDERTRGNDCVLIDTIEDEAPALLTDDTSATKIYVGEHSIARKRRSLHEKTSIDESREDYYDGRDGGGDGFGEFLRHTDDHRQFIRRQEPFRHRNFPTVRRNYPVEKYEEDEIEDPFGTWRPRRALPLEYFIEVMVVADAKMADYHGEGLTSYILVLMSTVSRIYKDPSIGNPISISVVKVTKTSNTFGGKHPNSAGVTANEMLKQFCLWQKHNNAPDHGHPNHHDAALLLTRENLCHNAAERRCDTLGLAELGRMCVPRASCAIVQDNGLAAAFTIAHEIGHVLSMPHDDDQKCRQFQGKTQIHNVMSRMLDDNTFPWEWSNCSRHYVTEFLDSGYANCLLDEPSEKISHPPSERLPGEDYSDNKQCELVFGPGSRICPYMVSDVCRRLWCTAPVWDREQHCHTQHMPWADGTACARGKWCQRGECVSRKNLKPVNGQWGRWKNYGECSRTCGGGIEKRYRECNNPPPQNGGDYCVGTRVEYRSCGTKDCPSHEQDFREEQCSKFNNNNMNIQNLARDVKWHAKYTRIQPDDRCKLYCEVESRQYYMLRDKVIDGTPCGLDTFHICVNGRCKQAGCDHELNSTAELDTCGICKGNNTSCQRITGSYNESKFGYNKVTRIPAGSSNIDIRQHGWKGSNNDSNYLALRNGIGGEYILNGKYMVAHHKVIVQPGLTIEYSGPESVVERLNSSRPISFDLILEILSVGNLYPPQISYEYTVPKKILPSYTWVLLDWSTCDRTCKGTRKRIAECRSTENKGDVSPQLCRSDEKPTEESQICNTRCTVRWDIVSKSECSNHCGPGTRAVTSQCISLGSAGSIPIAEHGCEGLEKPPDREPCTGPCDASHWLYGEWGSCSVSCGGGIQIRTATCVDSGERPVPEIKCNSQDRVLKKICGQESCPRWAVGEWTPCSVTCGLGRRERGFGCQLDNHIVAPNYCNSSPPVSVEPCDMGPCPSWHHGDWSPCSVSCGEGISRREVTCKTASGASSSDCVSSEIPLRTRVCMQHPCFVQKISSTPVTYTSDSSDYGKQRDSEIDTNKIFPEKLAFHSGYKWRNGNFGECSKSCAGGYKKRVIKCISTELGSYVHDDYCDKNNKPQATVPCNQHACARWNTGDWSDCDSECDSGFQHRQVRCQSERGEILPDQECSVSNKPHHVKRCIKKACVEGSPPTRKIHHPSSVAVEKSHRWMISKWGPCSKSCGTGTKTRSVDCIEKTGSTEVKVDDRECSGLKRKPKSERQCQRKPCDLTWQEGTWSECSAECGSGIQRRNVSCHRVNKFGWIDPGPVDGCKISERPANEQNCKLRECDDEYYWLPGPWKKCTVPCGRNGKQTRRLFCLRKDGRKMARTYCPIKFRPQRKRKCNQRRCAPASCLEAKKRLRKNEDDEYSLVIGGKIMSIYCHNMSGESPSEYLTLLAGDRENYAEFYDKRLMHPNTCPFNGQRNDNCNCIDVTGSTTGRTMFKRIRLDPRTLVVAVDDFTFSRTQGPQRIEFGKAGDCYSTVECPQGRFSINLTGTQLALSSSLSWVSYGSMATRDINRINQQKVVGKCGGFCGFCKLETGLKLDVLPP